MRNFSSYTYRATIVFTFVVGSFFVHLKSFADVQPELSPKDIALISSFDSQSEWGNRMLDGLNRVFIGDDYYVSKIELGSLSKGAAAKGMGDIDWIVNKVKERKVGTIIAVNQGAIDIVLQNISKFPKGIKVIIGGMMFPVDENIENIENIFIIKRNIDLYDNISLGRKMFPDIKKVFVITSGGRDGYFIHSILKNRTSEYYGMNFEFINGRESTTDDMISRIESSKEPFFVIIYNWFSIKDTVRKPFDVVTAELQKAAKSRVIAAYSSSQKYAIGGYMESPENLGQFIANKTKELIEADAEGQFLANVIDAPVSDLWINWTVFKQMDMSVKILPENVLFYNVSQPMFDATTFKYGFFVSSSLFIATLLLFIFFGHYFRARGKILKVLKKVPFDVYIFKSNGDIISSYSSRDHIEELKDISMFGEECRLFFEDGVKKIFTSESVSGEFDLFGARCKGIIQKLSDDKQMEDAYVLTTMDISDLVSVRNKFEEASKKLHDANKFLNIIIDNVPCGIFVKNYSDRGRYILGNKFLRYNLTRHPESLVGLTDFDFFSAERARKLRESDDKAVEDGEMFDLIEDIVAPDGTSSKCHTLKTSMKMENGDVYLFGITMNITELVQAQERLEAHSEQMRLLNECLRNALVASDPKDFIQDIISFIGKNISAQRCCFMKFDDILRKPVETFQWISDDSYARTIDLEKFTRFSLVDSYEKLRRGEMIIGENAREDLKLDNLKGVSDFSDVKSIIIVGIQKEKQLLGFLSVEFLEEKHEITELDRYLVNSAARIFEIVSERLESAAKVEESENIRGLLLNSIDIPIMLFDSNRKLMNANAAAAKLAGIPIENMSENVVSKGLFAEERPLMLDCIERGDEIAKEISMPNGKEYHVAMTPIFDKEKHLKYIVEYLLDMTKFNEGKRLLVKAMHDAQGADRAKSLFIATMSHELRTPLNAVIGYTELTQNPNIGNEERMQNLQNVNFAANTLLNLINEILDLSKLEAGQMEIHKAPVNMEYVAEEFSKIFSFATSKKKISITIESDKDTPVVMLDMLRLKQVLMNIIGNAVKFTDHGGIDVKIFSKEKTYDLVDLFIVVRDTGIGIGPEYIAKIFEPFTQDISNRTRGRGNYEGTGLGLPIVKRLVEKMGGDISITSVVNEGSEFKIQFKDVEVCRDETLIEKLKEERLSMLAPASKGENERINCKVLIVDDILLNVKVLKKMLVNIGATVIDTLLPSEVVDLAKEHKPDIIMTDLWMPEITGHTLAKIIKDTPEIKSIPVIAVTADTQVQDPENLFDEILFKPITTKSIVEKVNKVMKS